MKSRTIVSADTRVRRRANHRVRAIIAVVTFVIAGSLLASSAPAFATSYPTWADVVAARRSQASTKALVVKIESELSGLKKKLSAANTAASVANAAAISAEQSYALAKTKQQTLKLQQKAAAAKAKKSEEKLGAYASQLARGPSGSGGWSTMSLLLNGKSESQLLNDLGAIGQVSKQQNGLLEKALSEQKSVKQLTALATAQAGILNQRKQAADAAKAKAAAAAASLQTAVTAEATHEASLKVLLSALTSKLNLTEAGYEKGVAAAMGAGVAGVVDSAGWALPTVGVITSPYGYRYDPAQGYRWAMHYGDDIAHGCLQPIYAATGGTVTYAGIYSDYGNYIRIQHAGGVSTVYGHIANGETFVHLGQTVRAGQNIARTGSTGASTGCHLYFGVEVGGGWVNPVPFMLARGIRIG
ncbi:MAG TPA: M23 family metallopeptidase [Galbitalea sp.]|nr:M23 family metallopeptidase [Galbitalea sp.]